MLKKASATAGTAGGGSSRPMVKKRAPKAPSSDFNLDDILKRKLGATREIMQQAPPAELPPPPPPLPLAAKPQPEPEHYLKLGAVITVECVYSII